MEPDVLESDTEKLDLLDLFLKKVDISKLELANLMEDLHFSGVKRKGLPVKDMKKWKECCLGDQEDNDTKTEHQHLEVSEKDSPDTENDKLSGATDLSKRGSKSSHLVKETQMYNSTHADQKTLTQGSATYNVVHLGWLILKQEPQTNSSIHADQEIVTQYFWNKTAATSNQAIRRKDMQIHGSTASKQDLSAYRNHKEHQRKRKRFSMAKTHRTDLERTPDEILDQDLWAYRNQKEHQRKRKRFSMAKTHRTDSDRTPDEILDQIIGLQDDHGVKPRRMEVGEIIRLLKK